MIGCNLTAREVSAIATRSAVGDTTLHRLCLAIAVILGLMTPVSAHAQIGPIVVGGVLGGLVGSTYAQGAAATGAAVASAAAATANAIGATVPVIVSGLAATVAAASTPVIVGVVAGGALGYLLLH
jgi:hypothetical protein